MPELLSYLLKANAALALFYLAYRFALRRHTFYTLNRLFLAFGIIFSALYPFVDLSSFFSRHQELTQVYTYAPTMSAWVLTNYTPEQAASFDYWQLPVLLFWLGATMMGVRLLLQFASLYRIHTCSAPAIHEGVAYRETSSITEAFSFWQSIYLNPIHHKPAELDAILRHEVAHVRGWHTLDVLLAELSTVFFWFNPGMWLLKKAIKENLEFIADRQVVNAGADRKDYQYLLLKITGPSEPQIANQFHFPSLKTRIVMMNKMPSTGANRLRLLVALPIAALLLVAFRAPIQSINSIKEATLGTLVQDNNKNLPPDYAAFLKRNPSVKFVDWNLSGTKEGTDLINIYLKSGETETYSLTNKESMASAERKYGTLPNLPPPPPPYPSNLPVYIPEEGNRHADHTAFLKRNPQVKDVGWMMGEMKDRRVGLMVIYLQSGDSEIYDLDYGYGMASAEMKYGTLPQLPPPPPPVRKSKQ